MDLLSNYTGIVSDSRELVCYGSGFELFRRTFANVVEMVEVGRILRWNGERLVEHVAYNRPMELYGLYPPMVLIPRNGETPEWGQHTVT